MKKITLLLVIGFFSASFSTAMPRSYRSSASNSSSLKEFSKTAIQNAAGLTAIGALGYGGIKLGQSAYYWLNSSNENPETYRKTKNSLRHFLAALLIAAGATSIANADLTSVNFNIHFDIVRALEILLRDR